MLLSAERSRLEDNLIWYEITEQSGAISSFKDKEC